jgi:hypothetical protein
MAISVVDTGALANATDDTFEATCHWLGKDIDEFEIPEQK